MMIFCSHDGKLHERKINPCCSVAQTWHQNLCFSEKMCTTGTLPRTIRRSLHAASADACRSDRGKYQTLRVRPLEISVAGRLHRSTTYRGKLSGPLDAAKNGTEFAAAINDLFNALEKAIDDEDE